MLMNLPLVSLSISNIIKIDVTTVISPVLRINFAKIIPDNEVVISMTLLFCRMFSLVKISLSVINRVILLHYQWTIDEFGCDGW